MGIYSFSNIYKKMPYQLSQQYRKLNQSVILITLSFDMQIKPDKWWPYRTAALAATVYPARTPPDCSTDMDRYPQCCPQPKKHGPFDQ